MNGGPIPCHSRPGSAPQCGHLQHRKHVLHQTPSRRPRMFTVVSSTITAQATTWAELISRLSRLRQCVHAMAQTAQGCGQHVPLAAARRSDPRYLAKAMATARCAGLNDENLRPTEEKAKDCERFRGTRIARRTGHHRANSAQQLAEDGEQPA